MKEHREVLDSMKPMADVALVYPDSALKNTDENGRKFLLDGFSGLYKVLCANHVQFRIIFDHEISAEKLSGINVLVVTTAAAFDKGSELTAYTKAGGRVIMFDGGCLNEGTPYTLPLEIEELFGIKSRKGTGKADYILLNHEFSSDSPEYMGSIPVFQGYRDIECTLGKVLGEGATGNEPRTPEEFTGIRRTGAPLVTRRDYGAGCAIFISTCPGGIMLKYGLDDHLRFFRYLFKESGYNSFLQSSAPDVIGITAFACDKGIVLHLLNASGMYPLSSVPRLTNISISLKTERPSGITVNRPNIKPESVVFNYADGTLDFTLPYLDLYAMIVVKE